MISFQAVTKTPEQKKTLFLGLILLLLTLILFRDAASAMFEAWQQEEYSHGYLVPFVALLLLFNKMNDEHITPQSSWLGFGLIVICVIAQFLFQVAGVKGLQPQVFLLSLIGLFILFYGLKASRAVAGPLLIVMFAAPLPKFFYYTMSFNMQMMSTSLGTALLRLLGITVLQDGNIIDMGTYQMQVVEACNGLRFLFPLMCLGFMLAYMYKASFLKRSFLFVSTIPITIIMNSLRIALIGVTVDRWGEKMAEGLLHDFEGLVIFIGCALILMIEIQLMQRIGRKGYFDWESIRIPSFKSLSFPKPGAPNQATAVFLCLALAVSLGTTFLFPHYVQPVPLQKPMTEFPMQIGEWTGHKGQLDEKMLAVLGTEDYLIADFAKSGEPAVNLYMLYFPKQDSTSNQAVHSPEVCIPGGGWKIQSSDLKTIILQNSNVQKGSPLTVNRMLITKGQTKQIVYYWFTLGDQDVSDVTKSRLAAIKNALFKGRTNGAMVRLVTEARGGESEQTTEARLMGFMSENLDTINEFIFPLSKQHR